MRPDLRAGEGEWTGRIAAWTSLGIRVYPRYDVPSPNVNLRLTDDRHLVCPRLCPSTRACRPERAARSGVRTIAKSGFRAQFVIRGLTGGHRGTIYIREKTSRSSGCASADTMARLPRLYAPGCPNWCKPISSSPGSAVATRAGRYPESAGHLAGRVRPTPPGVGARLAARQRSHPAAGHARRRGRLAAPDADAGPQPRGAPARRRVFAGRYRSALLEPGAWVLPSQVWLKPIRCAAARRRIPIPGPGPRPAAIPATPARRPRNGSRTTPITGPAAIRRSTARPTTASACRTACRARNPNASTRRCLASGRWAAPASSPAWPTPPAAGSRRDSADVRARNQPRPRQPGTLLKRRPRL